MCKTNTIGVPFTVFTKLHQVSSSGTVKIFYLYFILIVHVLRPDMYSTLYEDLVYDFVMEAYRFILGILNGIPVYSACMLLS